MDFLKQMAFLYKDRFMLILNDKIKDILFKECNKKFGKFYMLWYMPKENCDRLAERDRYYTENWDRVMMKTLKSNSFKKKATFNGFTYQLMDSKGTVGVVPVDII